MDEQAAKEWQEYKRRPSNQEFRNRLVDRYYPLVIKCGNYVNKNLPPSVDIDDLVSVGLFGLMDAIAAYDLSRKVKFETYGFLRIRGAMLDELRCNDWVPRLVRSRAAKLSKAVDAFQCRHGRPPDFEELAEELSIDDSELESLLRETQVPGLSSLYCNVGGRSIEMGKDRDLIDMTKNSRAVMPFQDAGRMDFIRTVMKGLNKKELIIFLQYYVENQTMKQIGKQLDLSESRVSQIHSDVLGRMQKQFTREQLQDLM